MGQKVLKSENYVEFQKVWKLIMISSEAICETVGSIMDQHCGKNRCLTPENFSTEVVLRFNLGPIVLLMKFWHNQTTLEKLQKNSF